MSRISQILLLALILCWTTACIERYYPDQNDLNSGTLVINAHITDQPGRQVIEISRSATLLFSKYDPVSGCFAQIVREDGELRNFYETRPGFYGADLDQSFLQVGSFYRMHVLTPDGNIYESEMDKLRPVPEIDSIYYHVESASYQTEGDSIGGIRFFIDFTYDDEAYEYIRWELLETYEFHNPDIRAWIAINPWTVKPLPDTSNYRVCYITREVNEIHSMSTRYLDQGIYIKKPFGFVPNDKIEQKLLYKYSLLVKQYSVGKEAFHYWNELKKTSQEQGFLFDRQPALLKSNFYNINDSSEVLLGFFSTSCVSEIRGIAGDIPGLDHTPYKYYCLPVDKGPGTAEPTSWPGYYAQATYNGVTHYELVNKHCVDCRAYKGSTHIKPDYW